MYCFCQRAQIVFQRPYGPRKSQYCDSEEEIKLENFLLEFPVTEVSNNEATCDRMQSALHLDSDVPFPSFLKHEEVTEQMMNDRINVGEKGTTFIECGSSCDGLRLFDNDKFN